MKATTLPSRCWILAALALLFALTPASVKASTEYYFNSHAGATTCDPAGCDGWYGIDGYVRMSAYNPYPTTWPTEADLSWIGLCNNEGCPQWVQIGEWQGLWYNVTKLTGIGYYAENTDPCGVYNPLQITSIPPGQNADTAFYLNSSGTVRVDCGSGLQTYDLYNYYYNYSNFNGNRPSFQGIMTTQIGTATAETELHNINNGTPQYAATGTNFFGCNLNRSCGNDGYALHLRGSSGWVVWSQAESPETSWVADDLSPALNDITKYYNFSTYKGN